MKRAKAYLVAMLACATVVFLSTALSAEPQETSVATSKYLDVPAVKQEQNQWCWAGCARAVFLYYGQDVAQCTIANYNWGRTDCCTNPSSPACNNWTYLIPNVQNILRHWDVDSNALWSSASFNTLRSEIHDDRPVWVRWEWSGGGGHFVVIRGYNDDSGNKVSYMDPWYGAHYLTDYSWMVSGGTHTWTHSLTGIQYVGTPPTPTPTATETRTPTPTVTPSTIRHRVSLPIVCKIAMLDGTVTPTPPVTPTATPIPTYTPTATPTQPPSGPVEIGVSTDSGSQLHPAAAYNTQHGEYLVVWQERVDNADIYAQRVSSSGELRGSKIAVSTTSLRQQRPAVAYNSLRDEYLIVWQDGTGEENTSGHNYIHAQRLSWDGGRLGGVITISNASNWQVESDVAYNSRDDQYLVVWRDGAVNVHGQRLSGTGSLLGGNFIICSAPRQQNYPSIAYNPHANEYLVVWDDHRPNVHYDIYGRRISAGGVPRSEFAIGTLQGDQRRPKVAFCSSTNGYMVTWPDYRKNPSRPDYCGQLITEQGQLYGGLITLSTAGSGHSNQETVRDPLTAQWSEASFATVIHEKAVTAFDPGAGQYVIVWPDVGTRDIHAGYLHPTGSALGGKFTVCSAADDQREPAIAANHTSGGYLIAWQDKRSRLDFDIYAYVQP